MADDGFKTVVVSTDPAHSLGDALQMDLKGGGLIPVSGSKKRAGKSDTGRSAGGGDGACWDAFVPCGGAVGDI